MQRTATSWGARWIVPVTGPPLENAALVVGNGYIEAIVPGGRREAAIDLGEVAVLPRLVNAHTHLEFSLLARPLGTPGIRISDWIPLVVENRQHTARHAGVAGHRQATEAAVLHGLRECAACGTIAIGEIAVSAWFREAVGESLCLETDCHLSAFIERLGTDPGQISARIDELRQWLTGFEATGNARRRRIQPGISPHAPYSLHDGLFDELIELSVKAGLPVAMHLAESREELQWLDSGSGPLGDMLTALGAKVTPPSGRRPLDYLKRLRDAPHVLVVHGNYLDADELDLIGSLPERMHLVYCPRTHEYFGHEAWPLHEAMKRRINIAIGTDSRASSPDLNLWSELQLMCRKHPGTRPFDILYMGTMGGAKALGLAGPIGSLKPGALAKWIEVPVSAGNVDRLEDELFATPETSRIGPLVSA